MIFILMKQTPRNDQHNMTSLHFGAGMFPVYKLVYLLHSRRMSCLCTYLCVCVHCCLTQWDQILSKVTFEFFLYSSPKDYIRHMNERKRKTPQLNAFSIPFIIQLSRRMLSSCSAYCRGSPSPLTATALAACLPTCQVLVHSLLSMKPILTIRFLTIYIGSSQSPNGKVISMHQVLTAFIDFVHSIWGILSKRQI